MWNQEKIHLVLVVKKTFYMYYVNIHICMYYLLPAVCFSCTCKMPKNRVTDTQKINSGRVQVPSKCPQKKKLSGTVPPKTKHTTSTYMYMYKFWGVIPPTIILNLRHHHPHTMMIFHGTCFLGSGDLNPGKGTFHLLHL